MVGIHEWIDGNFHWFSKPSVKAARVHLPQVVVGHANPRKVGKFNKTLEQHKRTGTVVDAHVSCLFRKTLPSLKTRERFSRITKSEVQNYVYLLGAMHPKNPVNWTERDVKTFDRRALDYFCIMLDAGFVPVETQVAVGFSGKRVQINTSIDHVWESSSSTDICLVEFKVQHEPKMSAAVIGEDVKNLGFSSLENKRGLTKLDKFKIQAAMNHVMFVESARSSLASGEKRVISQVVVAHGDAIMKVQLSDELVCVAARVLKNL